MYSTFYNVIIGKGLFGSFIYLKDARATIKALNITCYIQDNTTGEIIEQYHKGKLLPENADFIFLRLPSFYDLKIF